jgi:hypothetical protein
VQGGEGGEMSDKKNNGFRVYGPTLYGNGEKHLWYFTTLKEAEHFCRCNCPSTEGEYEILKFVSRCRIAPRPVEFIPADDAIEEGE